MTRLLVEGRVGSARPAAWGRVFDERYAWAWLAAAMAVAACTILWLNRDTTFWIDELALFMESPDLDTRGALHPHVGHLVLTVRVAYKAIFELFGASYLPFRLLGVASVLLTVGLLFAYMKRRVPPYVALAPCLVLLFFGSDMLHVLAGNAFGVQLALSCGLGALLALERRDLKGDLAAAALLCLGAATYTIALAFVAGAAVLILLDRDRWRRLWVVAVPIVLYAAWFLWASSEFTSGPRNHGHLSDLLLLPAWGVQSLSAVFGALSGFDYSFPASSGPAGVGPVLAILALVGLGLRLRRGSIPPSLWAAFAVLLALWSLGAVGSSGNRPPDLPRYLYPGAVAILLVAAGCAAGLRWPRTAVVALYAIAVSGLAVNLVLLRDAGGLLRDSYAAQARAGFAGLDVAGERVRPRFDPPPITTEESAVGGEQSPLAFSFTTVYEFGGEPVPGYEAAARDYGPLGFSLPDLRASADEVRAQTDSVLVGALGLRLQPAPEGAGLDCRRYAAGEDGSAYARLPRGGAVLVGDRGGTVEVQRFAEGWWVPLGELGRDRSLLRVPVDRAPDPWWVSAAVPSLQVCELR